MHLKDMAPRRQWTIRIAHCEHRLRGEGAARDAEFVRAFAEREGLPFHHLHVLKTEFASGESVEAELREERYALLRGLARETGAVAIALGHQATDAAETFLMMAMRGSGPHGLGSMKAEARIPAADVHIVRPLLHLTREEVRASLRQRGIAWIEDPTNASDRFRRNRVRSEVIPLLEAMQPGVVRTLARSARLCAEENDLLELEVLCGAPKHSAEGRNPRYVLHDADDFSGDSAFDAVHLRIVIRSHSEWAVDGPAAALSPSYAVLEDLLERLRNRNAEETRFVLGPSTAAFVAGRWLLLHRPGLDPVDLLADAFARAGRCLCRAEQEAATETGVGRSSTLAIAGRGDLVFEPAKPADWLRSPERLKLLAEKKHALLAPVSGTGPILVVREMGADELVVTKAGRRAVRDILQEAGIPACLRPRVLGICDDAQVLWIPGVRRADAGMVDPDSPNAIVARWTPPS